MAEAASISYGNEFSSEPRKSPLNKHIPESSKVRKTPDWFTHRLIQFPESIHSSENDREGPFDPLAASLNYLSRAALHPILAVDSNISAKL